MCVKNAKRRPKIITDWNEYLIYFSSVKVLCFLFKLRSHDYKVITNALRALYSKGKTTFFEGSFVHACFHVLINICDKITQNHSIC